MASSLIHAAAPVAGSLSATWFFKANVVASSAARCPLARPLTGTAVLNTTYSVAPSSDSAGAQLVCGLTRLVLPVAALAVTWRIVPSAPMRAMPPPEGPPGVRAVMVKPKKTLPALSLVSGVLMYTVASKAPGAAK